MKIIFISDLHLTADSSNKNLLFFSALKQWRGAINALYILGDFFDYWLGDDDDNLFIQQIKSALKDFTCVTPIYFCHGNHDFALGKAFAQQSGIQFIRDLHTLVADDQRILLSHGDTFCSLDISYQRMKKILRNPIVIFLLRRLPLKLRYKIKEKLESSSHNRNPDKSHLEHLYQVVPKSVIASAVQANAAIVIHGHTHNPGYYPLTGPSGTTIHRYEIPDWEERPPGGYILWNNGKLSSSTLPSSLA
jgi:UDP-2,3-diacylglucosamine hydrolase